MARQTSIDRGVSQVKHSFPLLFQNGMRKLDHMAPLLLLLLLRRRLEPPLPSPLSIMHMFSRRISVGPILDPDPKVL